MSSLVKNTRCPDELRTFDGAVGTLARPSGCKFNQPLICHFCFGLINMVKNKVVYSVSFQLQEIGFQFVYDDIFMPRLYFTEYKRGLRLSHVKCA